jgi:hypothetical protein
MSDYAKPHGQAMAAAEEYDALRRRGEERAAAVALRRAADLEAVAAERTPKNLEPTRSVLFRSAATLAHELGDTLAARHLAMEGLRGNPPAEIKAELFEILDKISQPRVGALASGALVQRLGIRSARRTSSRLDLEGVGKIHQEWNRTLAAFSKNGAVQFVPIDASIGSFFVQLELRRDTSDFGDVIQALRELAETDGPGAAADDRSKAAAQRRSSMLSLLVALTEADAILEVTTTGPGTKGLQTIEIRPPEPEELAQLQQEASGMIPSEDVPQADDLETVFRFVEFIAKGKYPTPADLDVVPRQVNYYRRATEILGYRRNGALTPLGGVLHRLTGKAKWRAALAHFMVTDVASAWLAWSKKRSFEQIDPQSAEAFLAACATGLSPSTTKRRAQTLRTWHLTLIERTTEG